MSCTKCALRANKLLAQLGFRWGAVGPYRLPCFTFETKYFSLAIPYTSITQFHSRLSIFAILVRIVFGKSLKREDEFFRISYFNPLVCTDKIMDWHKAQGDMDSAFCIAYGHPTGPKGEDGTQPGESRFFGSEFIPILGEGNPTILEPLPVEERHCE